ncbi:PTS mannitol transporter subunit IIA [Paenibacillus darwinianus]|uniref:Mannitol-specific phosphotransferase enzyme IIA component n=1 Tax=Paenibacillus darwinianus TaxID=1380763 RepID=A0A9W5W8N1_9BACL|nr:PTS sugar transporter subunit IIA [Paenibacillus darwinianus]EXX86874.1 PTS mannitol transporter subunit IIA [Paenibacillus darwinianus]EXX90647.1 PTS mannitol transporter subunit IIA [Paenibacillus darwinianus]EXX91608.1 PTS mannitol transporter subunit IIA [Paenibacillus darwinianus]
MRILSRSKVRLNVKVGDKNEAIRLAGQLLVNDGHVPPEYVDKMIERDSVSSTYLGNGVAMPHGTNESKSLIKSTGMSVLTVPGGVDFGGQTANLIIGLAAVGSEHMEILSNVAVLVSDDDEMGRILEAGSAEELLSIFEQGMNG